MNTKALFPCGGVSNLILGTGRKNQTIIFNACIIFEKKKTGKISIRKKICQIKNLLGKQFLSEKIL